MVETAYNWARHELRPAPPIPWNRRLAMWRRGFFAEATLLYDFPNNDPSEYLSDYRHMRCEPLVAWRWLFKHKLALRAYLLSMGLRQPETVAYIHEGQIVADPFGGSPRAISPEELAALLRKDGSEYLVKPEDGGGGRDAFLLSCEQGNLVQRRGEVVQPLDLAVYLRKLASSGLPRATLVERRIEQAGVSHTLFPGSGNTVRVLTLWSAVDREPFIPHAVQRIGTRDTVPTDNWTGGGISAPVDLGSGRLGPGRMHPFKGKRTELRYASHPDTGARIDGMVLPYWNRITETVLRAATALPFNRVAGWDVLVDRDEVPVILEANGNSDIDLHQVHGGLLRDSRTRRFFEVSGIISPARGA